MSNRTLRLNSPVALGTPRYVETLTKAVNWSHTTRLQGGYWRGKFSLFDKATRLANYFYEILGYDLVELSGGGVTWNGMIYEMDYSNKGISRRRTLQKMYNHVAAKYLDTDDKPQTSTAAENTASQARYGTRQELRLLDGYPQAAAENDRDTFLREHAFPAAWAVGTDLQSKGARLDVVVHGYIHTANWQYQSAGDSAEHNISDWITAIIGTNCPFLRAGSIEENTKQQIEKTPMPSRAWDVISNLVEIGGANPAPWRFYVDNDRRAYYREMESTPTLFIRDGGVYTSVGTPHQVNPWKIKPGVFRDIDYPARKFEVDTWLDDGRDFLVEEVEYGDGFKAPVLKTRDFLESELLAAQQRAAMQAKNMAESEQGGGGRVDTWHNFRPGSPQWGRLTEEEQELIRNKYMS